MQNITIVGDKFRMYPKALEKAPIPSSGSKQSCVKVKSVVQNLWNSFSISRTQLRIQRFRRSSNRTPNGPETRFETL